MPMHLPDAPEPAAPWDPPPEDPEERKLFADQFGPGHCSSWDGAAEEQCKGLDHANLKQKRNLRLLSRLTGSPVPDVEQMSTGEADRWVGARWSEWMEQQRAKKRAMGGKPAKW